MSLLSSIIPEPYAILARIAAVVLVLTGAFATGWIKRGEHDQLAQDTQIIKDQTKVIKITQTQTVVDDKAVTALQAQLTALRNRNDKIQKTITVTVHDSCNLSSDWVHDYNDSIQTNDASSSTGSNAGTRTTPATSH